MQRRSLDGTTRRELWRIEACHDRSSGNRVISKRNAIRHTLKAIADGIGVAIVIDQNVRDGARLFVDFFGRPAATTTVAAALALKTGCALIPSHTELGPDGRYALVYEPAIAWAPSGDHALDLRTLTQRLTSAIEAWVRRRPEQWLWLHRRWKTRPAEGPR